MGLIKVNDLYYSYVSKYQTVHALRGIDCEFEKGKIYAITGASGSGKTTLMSLLAGLDSPSAGEILIDGIDMQAINKDEFRRQRATVIYQAYNLFPLLNTLENVTYPLLINKVPKKEATRKAKECVKMVGLEDKICKQYPQMMSGGEQQRVAIARAMACGGDIILADEPTGNLDSENEKNIVEILKRLAHEDGKLVIVITHNPRVAEAADVQYKMKDGKLEEDIMMNIAICDSDVKFTGYVEEFLREKALKMNVQIEVEVFFDGKPLQQSVQAGNKYDLIFMGNEMEHVDEIEAEPFRFISKPVELGIITKYFEAAVDKTTEQGAYFQYTFNKRICKVLLNDVMYFESQNRKINIVLGDGSSREFYDRLNEVEEEVLASSSQFLRIHQSYLINCNYIREATQADMTLRNGLGDEIILKVSRERQRNINAKLPHLFS